MPAGPAAPEEGSGMVGGSTSFLSPLHANLDLKRQTQKGPVTLLIQA